MRSSSVSPYIISRWPLAVPNSRILARIVFCAASHAWQMTCDRQISCASGGKPNQKLADFRKMLTES
jgi:hypothetical protein